MADKNEWIRAARKAGWEPLEPPKGRLDWWRLKCAECGREDVRQYAVLSGCRHGAPLAPGYAAAAAKVEETARERLEEAGWEPLEPWPGAAAAGWNIRCTTCGQETRRSSQRPDIRPCTHIGWTHRKTEAAFGEWRERVEGGDVQEAVRLLLMSGWEPAEEFPGRVILPWQVRCVRCGREKGIVLAHDIPRCSHPGGDARPLTQPEKGGLRAERQRLRDEEVMEWAREAGWEPQGPPPGLRLPWRLKCATCGRVAIVTKVSGQYATPCTHKPDPMEEVFREAGWEPLEAPVPGMLTDKWRIRCMTCGHEKKHNGKRLRPHSHQED